MPPRSSQTRGTVGQRVLVIFSLGLMAWMAVGAIGLLIYHAIDC